MDCLLVSHTHWDRLDEKPAEPTTSAPIHVDGNGAVLMIPPHGLRSLRIGPVA
jgi:hypothetical protein